MRRYSQRTLQRSSYKPRSVRKLEKTNQKNLIITAVLILLVLYFTFSWGIPALINGLSFFNKLKPGPAPAAVTEDSAIAPPVLNIPYEATNTAQIKINGYATPGNKVEIYLDDQLQDSVDVNADGSFQTKDINLSDGNNDFYGKTIQDNRKSLASKTIRVFYSSDKPKLDLSGPGDGSQITGGDKKVTVSGITDPDSTITVNGTTVIVNSDGSFSTVININDGDNNISVVAQNSVGNTTTMDRHVKYKSS